MSRTVTAVALLSVFLFGSTSSGQEMKAHFIDVGQAASTLLEFPCGAILIDTGAQDDEHVDHLAEYLRDFFARRPDLHNTLSALYISHPHLDHTRGVREVFRTCRVARYFDNGIVSGSGRAGPQFVRDGKQAGTLNVELFEIHDRAITALPERHGLTNDDIDPCKCAKCDPSIRILSGGMEENPGWTDGEWDNLNNHSLVLRVDFGKASFLFTGDLEEPAIETLVEWYQDTDMLDVDVYLVGHHGSGNGTTSSLVNAMTPELAVLGVGSSSFGKGKKRGFNTYSFGHPRRSIIDLLSASIPNKRSKAIDVDVADAARRFSEYHVTKRIYATGWDGDVVVSAKLDGTTRVTKGSSE